MRDRDNVGLDQVLHRDDVELDAFESDVHGCIDSSQDARQIVAAGDLFEALAIERVEMDIQAAKTGIVERLCVLLEQDGVGGQREVANPRDRGKAFDQPRQIAAEQRFAAGETQFVDAERGRDAHEALDLLEGEDLLRGRELDRALPACSRSSGCCSDRSR